MPTHHRDDQELMRYLLRTADQLGGASYVAPYRELLERLIREGQYGTTEEEDGRETFMEQAEMAQLLHKGFPTVLLFASSILSLTYESLE